VSLGTKNRVAPAIEDAVVTMAMDEPTSRTGMNASWPRPRMRCAHGTEE